MLTIERLFSHLCRSRLSRVAGLFLVFPVFLIQLCLYLNINDRPAEPPSFLLTAMIVFFILAMTLYVSLRISGFISRQAPAFLLGIFDVLFICLFVLAMFFPVEYTLLDGQEYPPVPFFETIRHCAVAAMVMATSVYISKKKPFEFEILRMTVFAAGIFFIVYSTISMNIDYKNNLKLAENTTEAAFKLGERNVVLLIVETFQGDYLEELAADSPELFTSFSGMTLFPKAVTSTWWSPFSVVQIFSGGHDWSGLDTRAAAIDMLNDDSLLTTARELGYRFSGGNYTPVPGEKYASTPEADLALKVRLPRIVLTHSRYYFASFRRIVPAVAWTKLQKLENKIYHRWLLAGQYLNKIAAKDNFIGLIDCLRNGDSNSFLYFFNYMTHLEILFDREGNAIPGLPQNKKTQMDEYAFTLSLYSAFLDKLKSLEVYDNSLIIIAGDHGSYNEPGRKYNPAILVKPPRSEGELSISPANILHTDIRPLVEAYMREGDDACRTEFLRLAQEVEPRRIRVFAHAGRDHDSGRNWLPQDIFGDIETVVSRMNND